MTQKGIRYFLTVLLIFIGMQAIAAVDDAASKMAIKELIVKHSVEMGLDPALALSIAKAESGYCHEKRSRYGAVGVFQLMPSTAKKLGYNPYQIQDNIKGGIKYFQMMYKMFGSTELALAAYNAGPGNVKKYNGIPPFKETKKFVSSIMISYNKLKAEPDPAMEQYNASIKEISEKIAQEDLILREEDFRMQQEAVLKTYLSNQGI